MHDLQKEPTFKFASAARKTPQREISFEERCEAVERVTEKSHKRRTRKRKQQKG